MVDASLIDRDNRFYTPYMNRSILLLLLLAGCGPAKKTDKPEAGVLASDFKMPYTLTKPTNEYKLPKALNEISGLTYYKNDKLLCVQDEDAVVYVFDTQKKKIAWQFGFGGYGDFEGIEYVNDEVFVLESNGNLFRFKPVSPPSGAASDIDVPTASPVGRTKTDLPAGTEVEGLGYNPKSKRLLIAVKKSKSESARNAVYSFDLLNRAVYKDMSLTDEQLTVAGIDPKTYEPSGIAVHPITGDWYMLTSAGKRLVITNWQAKITYSEPLDPKLFRQPEGICFAPNGDMFIASEGNGKKGYILKFDYRK